MQQFKEIMDSGNFASLINNIFFILGIHQFVHMLDGHDTYPCLKDSTDTVLSFPPITNSGVSK